MRPHGSVLHHSRTWKPVPHACSLRRRSSALAFISRLARVFFRFPIASSCVRESGSNTSFIALSSWSPRLQACERSSACTHSLQRSRRHARMCLRVRMWCSQAVSIASIFFKRVVLEITHKSRAAAMYVKTIVMQQARSRVCKRCFERSLEQTCGET